MTTHIWLRAETKPLEQRTSLTPKRARELVQAGFQVTVEQSDQRAFAEEDYRAAGCMIVPEHRWMIDAPPDALILGLKELDDSVKSLAHRHIHFAHVYKNQTGWQQVLSRFERDGGALYDLEYLIDDQGRRVAAFGYWAGFAGAALAVVAWAGQQFGDQPILPAVSSRDSKDLLLADVTAALDLIKRTPKVMVIGALGRSGRGACELLRAVGADLTEWDLEETMPGGPFVETLDHDILLNCVFVQSAVPPFVTPEILDTAHRQLSLICDVSCDPHGDYNPLPIYEKCTTFDEPTTRLIAGQTPLDVIAIDHLPSLLPVESSEDFCDQLTPYLLKLNRLDEGVWHCAFEVFQEKCGELSEPGQLAEPNACANEKPG